MQYETIYYELKAYFDSENTRKKVIEFVQDLKKKNFVIKKIFIL